MSLRRFTLNLVLSSIYLTLTSPQILAGAASPAVQPYAFESQEANPEMRCQDLEVQITTLEPSSYSDKAGFYSDAAHGAAIWGGMLWAPALGYLGYSGLVEYRQRQRMADAQRSHRTSAPSEGPATLL